MNKVLWVFGTVVAVLFSGCGTFQMQTYANSTNTIFFKNLKPQKSIFLISKNSSSVDSKIGNLVKKDLVKKGYIVTNNPDNAQYILRVNALNFNHDQEQNVASGAGSLGASSALIGGASSRDLKGGIVAGLAGAAIGGIFAYATQDGTIKMQTDVFITEQDKDGNIDYRTRILAEAVQMHLTPAKAQPILEKKIAKKIAGIFQ